MRAIEKNIPLRVFNYLRIRHGYWAQYNLIFPFLLTTSFFLLLFFVSESFSALGSTGVLSEFTQLLAILSPFFLASLAAVSTFSGYGNFDEEIGMADPPKIERYVRGRWEGPFILTTRQFLSLLFGYCATISILLFLTAVVASRAQPIGSPYAPLSEQIVNGAIIGTFLFVFFHMIVATILGVYYLSDKMHRAE